MAQGNILVASEALQALFSGEDGRQAEVGALLVAEFLQLIRSFLTGK